MARIYNQGFTSLQLSELFIELKFLKSTLQKDKRFNDLKNIRELCSTFVNYGFPKHYPQFYKLLVLVLTLPITTASVERAFSSLKYIKNYIRTKIGDDWLEDLMLMYINKDYSINLNKVIESFKNKKDRRMKLS